METLHTEAPAQVKAIKFNGYKIDLTTDIKGRPVARLYKWLTVGKNKDTYKLLEGYFFGDEARREHWIKEKMANIKANLETDSKNKEARKEAAGQHPYKIGDILYQSWGYDQTNIDFFEVVGILPKSVKIRPISQKMVEGSGGFMCENVTPANGKYIGDTMTKPVKAWLREGTQPNFYVSNGRHSLSLYTHGEKGVYQSHYA